MTETEEFVDEIPEVEATPEDQIPDPDFVEKQDDVE